MTFYSSGNCLADTKSYVAFANSPLSPNFTDDTAPGTSNCGSTLQMNLDPNGGVVTLLAPWINTTVVIRTHADLLAVTLQVPGHLAFESEGLCRGCPAHAYFDAVEFSTNAGDCIEESTTALFLCWEFTRDLFSEEASNISYGEICRYNLLRANSSDYGVVNFQKAVVADALLLRNYGNVPQRNFDLVELGGSDGAGIINDSCNPPHQSNDTTDPIDTTDHTTTATSTEDSGGGRATTPGHSSSTKQPVSITDAGSRTLEISSAIHDHRRQAITSLLSVGFLSVLLSKLLFR